MVWSEWEKKCCNMYKHVHKLMCNRGNFMKLQECVYKEAGLLNQENVIGWIGCLANGPMSLFMYFHMKNFLQAGLCGDNLRPPIGPGATCDTKCHHYTKAQREKLFFALLLI